MSSNVENADTTTTSSTFSCSKCDYVCGSKRVLAAHDSAAHSDKVYQCPHCPFVSRYQANFYRHRRVVHKIGRTTCNVCNLDCESIDALIQHKELDHGQGLEEVLQRYEKDKETAVNDKKREESRDDYVNFDVEERERLKKAEDLYFSGYGYQALQQQSEEPINYSTKDGQNEEALEPDYEQASTSTQPTSQQPVQQTYNADMAQRSPLKVKRHYTCKDCSMQTLDPREFLYHRKEVHSDRITVQECPYCIYATKHFQKLQRHCGLVHKNYPKLTIKPSEGGSYQPTQAVKTARKSAPNRTSPVKTPARPSTSLATPKVALKLPIRRSSTSNSATSSIVSKLVNPVIKCTRCDFQCKSRILMNQHEKTVHLRRRFFRCLQCGYVTNERGRYTKHVKYHSLPKVKCEECDFYTTYKWNLDRHMKSHEMEGPYKCTRCSFSANNRQSLSFHLAKHHDGGNPNQTEQEEEEEIDPMMEDDELEPGSNDEFEEEDAPEVEEDDDQEILNENSLEDFLGSDSHLTCRFCSFKTYSKSTLATHEESHGSSKRYPCPLCGISFDHVAWLAKHLTQKHGEATDSKDITRAHKEAKRRSQQQPPNLEGESSGLGLSRLSTPPSSPPVLKMNKTSKTSLLSSPKDQKLTIGPRAKKSMPKKSEPEASASDSATEVPRTPKLQHSCTVCSFKSRWLSEIEKHVRVHSLERPFGCPSCKYRCKWKGDLKRHVMKYHDEGLVELVEKMKTPIPDGSVGYTTREIEKTRSEIIEEKKNESLKIKLAATKPPEKAVIPARSILKPVRLRNLLTRGRDDTDCRKSLRNVPRRGYDSEDTEVSVVGNESDQGDLVIDESYGASGYEPNVVYNRKRERVSEKTPPSPPSAKKAKLSEFQSDKGSNNQSPMANKKYKCTFCPFMSRTASRFHVHIVQHLNKKPFMCSTCFYRSNWEWDITKHIKIKSVRDEAHRHASMLVTDESGRKNYEKYNRFLVDAEDSGAEDDAVETIEDEEEAMRTPEVDVEVNEQLDYDISPDDVENIVVTPDLGDDKEEEQVESIELDLSRYFNSLGASPEKVPEKTHTPSSKLYYCRHCSFKNAEKKSVVGHLSVHTGTKPYQCRICGMVSNWKHVILRHVKMRHGGGLDDVKNRLNYVENNSVIELTGYPELASVRPTKDPPKLKKVTPVSTPKTDNLFTCEMCPYTCEKLCYMHFHIKQHKPREGANVKCPYCDYWVNFKKTLNRHLKVHQEKTEEFPQEETLIPDVTFNEGENEYQEGEEFMQVQLPTPKKNGQKKFKCDFCPYTTEKKRHKLYHTQFHRPNKAAPFKCDYCSYWAMHSHLITQHRKKCHPDDNNGLPTFTNPTEERIPPAVEIFLPSKSLLNQQPQIETEPVVNLTENEVVVTEHNGKKIRMIKCRYCPMMNRRRSNVRAHEEMHSEIKNSKFPCTVCNYQCNSQGVLTSHFKLHTAEEEKLQLEAGAGSTIDFDFLNQATYVPKTPPSSSVPKSPGGRFTYFCLSCPAMFKSRSDYQTHSSFHGSSFPFACDRCNYRARHKPHLHKHFLVHSDGYTARREAAQPSSGQATPVTPQSPKAPASADEGQLQPDDSGNSSTQMSSVNQMLLLEERETSMFLEKGFGKQTPKVNQCPNCPATFQKPSVLTFHKYLHGVNGKYYCPHCDYSVNEIKNLKTHQKLHPVKASTVRTVLKIFSCNKCPAVFTKNNRYVKHIEYHGKDNKFTCERCDFSVNLLISLVKHRNVHKKEMATEQQGVAAIASPNSSSVMPTVSEEPTPELDAEKQPDVAKPDIKEKVTYCCNRCPYFHVRRDAMMNHHKRHTANAAIHCPHCDYSTVQASFLRDHIKWHFQPQKLIKPNSFMKYSELEVWSVKDEKRLMLFKDHGEDKENERFNSPMMDDSDNEIIEVPTPLKPPALEITIDDNQDLAQSALQKSNQLEVLLTDVFKPSVRKLMDSPETPAAKKRKLDDSQTEDSDAEKLVIDHEYISKELRSPTPQCENGYLSTSIIEEEVEEEYEHREYVPDDPPAPPPIVIEPAKPTKITCEICPYTTDQLCTMQIHKTRHEPREGAKFKCPRCNYWTSDIKSMKRHLKLHNQKEAEAEDDTSAKNAAEADTSGKNAAEIDTSGKNAAEIDTSGKNAAEIDTSAKNAAEIDTSAKNAAEIDTSAKNAAEIDTSAKNAAEIDTSAKNAAEIDTSAKNAAEIDTSAKNAAEIDTSAKNAAEIDTSAKNAAEIDTSAKDAAEIDTSAKNVAEIDTSAKNAAEIDTSVKNAAEIDKSAKNAAEVGTSAKIAAEVDSPVNIVAKVDSSVNNAAEVDSSVNIAAEVDSSVNIAAEVDSSVNIAAEVDSSVNIAAEVDSSVKSAAEVDTSGKNEAENLRKHAEVDQSETQNIDEARNAIDDQEVIDAVENMLQETHFDDEMDLTPSVHDQDDVLERVEMDYRDLDEVVVKENDQNKTPPTSRLNEDEEMEVNALEEDSSEINHTYAEFEGSPEATVEDAKIEGEAKKEPLNFCNDNKLASLAPVSSEKNHPEMVKLTPAGSSENSPQAVFECITLENIPVSTEKSQEIGSESISISSDLHNIKKTAENAQVSSENNQVDSPENNTKEICVLTPAVSPDNRLQEINELTPDESPENSPQGECESTQLSSESGPKEPDTIPELSENKLQELSEPAPEASSPNALSPGIALVTESTENTRKDNEPVVSSAEHNAEHKLDEIPIPSTSIENELPLSPISSEDIQEECFSEPEVEEKDNIEELAIPSPVSIEDNSEPESKSQERANENMLVPRNSNMDQTTVTSPESTQNSQGQKPNDESTIDSENLQASKEITLPLSSPITPETPPQDDKNDRDEDNCLSSPLGEDETNETEEVARQSPENIIENEDLETLKFTRSENDPKTLDEGQRGVVTPEDSSFENVDAKEPDNIIQSQLLKAYFSSDVTFPRDDTSSQENDTKSSMDDDSVAENKSASEIQSPVDMETSEKPVETSVNHEPSSSIKDSIKILSFEDLSPEAASLHAEPSPAPSVANEDAPVSSVDMDNLEDDMEQDEADLSQSEIDMSDMIIHEESESNPSQVETKDDLNFKVDVSTANEFNEQPVNAADQEASDILLNMASEFFSNGSNRTSTNNLNSQDGTIEWPAEIPNKNDVLANLLMNAGVYSDDENSNPLL